MASSAPQPSVPGAAEPGTSADATTATTPATSRTGSTAASAGTDPSATAQHPAPGSATPATDTIGRKVEKVLQAHSGLLRAVPGQDDLVTSLAGLDGLLEDNTKHARNNLRSKIEQQALVANQQFITVFSSVFEALAGVETELAGMTSACKQMTERLAKAKSETSALVTQTNNLKQAQDQAELRRKLLDAFTARYQLPPDDKAVLLGDRPFDMTFFSALERVQAIHADCRRLLRTNHQRAGVDIMDDMANIQDRAYERLYHWTQNACRGLTTEHVDNSKRLNLAFLALRSRPVLLQYSLNELATARRNARVRTFSDALTFGGPNGSPPPIEMHSHDPLRYISDMLAHVHQTLLAERDLLRTIVGTDRTVQQGAGSNHAMTGEQLRPFLYLATRCVMMASSSLRVGEALDAIAEGLTRPFRMRAEAVLSALQSDIVMAYKVAALLEFYRQSSQELIKLDRTSSLAEVIQELHAKTLKIFFNALEIRANDLLVNVDVAPASLSPPDSLVRIMSTVREVLDAQATSYGRQGDDGAQELEKAAYMLNCFYHIQTVLTLYDSTHRRLEVIESEMERHIDTLMVVVTTAPMLVNAEGEPVAAMAAEPRFPDRFICPFPHRCVGEDCRYKPMMRAPALRPMTFSWYPASCDDCRCVADNRYANPHGFSFVFTVSTGHSGTGFLGNEAVWAHALRRPSLEGTPVLVFHERHDRRNMLPNIQQRWNVCDVAWTFVVEDMVPFMEQQLLAKNRSIFFSSGHDMTVGLLPALVSYLGPAVSLVRVRRDRVRVAKSFTISVPLGPEAQRCFFCINPDSLLNRCPWRDRQAFAQLSSFQRFLHASDEMECQWQSLRHSFPHQRTFVLNWTTSISEEEMQALAYFVGELQPLSPSAEDLPLLKWIKNQHHRSRALNTSVPQDFQVELAQHAQALGVTLTHCNNMTCIPSPNSSVRGEAGTI
ncbi:uncharacterized protein MONBRDRAFT_11210 [Monosiga brevicollis MX1]|uniref:Conserved oligomeric Golgi complex subunit 6 n=1 Tax=Monosiga brevicollis TaxID=81824 RepID=A9V8J1_MONBE|nr:uncharacterized protein MONBRDRAFT_11210 [Monosiga brevicollis MX1]EDQ86092.1 predicted protein [Monosiga brevicollis MX1]|eukprot:XP_001749017.1 hypothetical protein [Monosiga brevicollis MX1]